MPTNALLCKTCEADNDSPVEEMLAWSRKAVDTREPHPLWAASVSIRHVCI